MTYSPKPKPKGVATEGVKCEAVYSAISRRAVMRNISDFFDSEFDLEENRLHNEAMHNWYCVYCGDWMPNSDGVITKESVVWDHFYPVRHWGIKTLGNFLVSCPVCNGEKSAQAPVDYYRYRLDSGLPTHFKTIEEFEEFVKAFTEPFRVNFPDEHKLASEYRVEDETEESWRDILFRFLGAKDESGAPTIKFTESGGGSKLRPKSASGPLFEKLWNDETREGVRGSISRLQTMFDDRFEARDPLSLTAKEFKGLTYSSLFHTLSMSSSSSYGFMKNALQLLGDALDDNNKVTTYSEIVASTGGAASWRTRVDPKYIDRSYEEYRRAKRAKLANRAAALRARADELDLRAESINTDTSEGD